MYIAIKFYNTGEIGSVCTVLWEPLTVVLGVLYWEKSEEWMIAGESESVRKREMEI